MQASQSNKNSQAVKNGLCHFTQLGCFGLDTVPYLQSQLQNQLWSIVLSVFLFFLHVNRK